MGILEAKKEKIHDDIHFKKAVLEKTASWFSRSPEKFSKRKLFSEKRKPHSGGVRELDGTIFNSLYKNANDEYDVKITGRS